MTSYGIVGGGISGLTAAYRLRVALGDDATITLFDPAEKLGGVLRTDAPSHYIFGQDGESEEAFVDRIVGNLERLILREGPETIGAFIAEPVNGGGGVIVPPQGYFAKVQEVLRRYDILFMDWYMPEMNGAALLEVIRAPLFPDNGQVPVAMMTAYPNRELFARAKELGAAEVLVKPFGVPQAATVLGRLLPDGWALPDDEDGKQVLL